MKNASWESVARSARELYESQLRADLEAHHMNEFVAIEPVSCEYFLGPSLSEAMEVLRGKYPERLAHVIRVGHEAAVHIGYHQ